MQAQLSTLQCPHDLAEAAARAPAPLARGAASDGQATQSDDFAVRLEGVSKSYGTVPVLHTLDLCIRKGEFLTLLGPSGSGKSTILNIISGAALPTTGRVFLNGRDVTSTPSRERGLGMVFQHYALMPHLSVRDNVAFPLKIRKMPAHQIERKVTEVLERVGLAGFDQRKPRQLSAGQQQRVSIARCLAYSPSIILMDEPLGALDKKLRDQLQAEIKSLHRDIGTTLIYVTHDQEEALNLSDTICLMNGGRVEQCGPPAQLYFEPANRFVADFVGESNILSCTATDTESLVTGFGTHLRARGRSPRAGEPVEVLVRPECIRIVGACEAPANGDNLAEAVVEDLAFVGGRTRIGCRVGEHRLLVTRASIRDDATVAPGARLRLAWSPADTVVLGSPRG